jgi:hypothetical protein
MEDVLAPRLKLGGAKEAGDHEMIFIRGFKDPTTARVQQIVKDDYIDLKAKILQSAEIQTCLGGGVDPYLINNVLIPKIIRQSFPDLDDDEVDSVADHVIAGSALNGAQRISQGGRQLIQLANSFVNVDELNIDLIYQINPFASAYQIVSKELDAATLKAIQDYIVASRIDVTDDEAMRLWPEVERFYQNHGQEPLKDSLDPHEKRLAEVLAYLRRVKNESRP